MSPEKIAEKLAELEALLFIHGEPLPLKKIEKILDLDAGALKEVMDGLRKSLESQDRGLALTMLGDKVQLVTKPQFKKIVEIFVRGELNEDLSPASLETLAIIAYFGPIGRNKIEYERGVNSSFILRSLLLRGLVERTPDPKYPNSYLYDMSFDFIKHLGIVKREELPEYEKLKTLLLDVESGQAQEENAPKT